MNTLKSISCFFLLMFNLVPALVTTQCSDGSPIPINDVRYQNELSSIRDILKAAKDRRIVQNLDWNVFGDTVVRIYKEETDIEFISEMTDWLIRDIPVQNWDAPEKAIRQFLIDSRRRFDREPVRLKLLDLLIFKAPISDYSKPEFTLFLQDEMPSIRKRMIHVYKEDGTEDVIPVLDTMRASLKSKPSPNASDLEELLLLEEANESIRLWAERYRSNWVPDETEVKKQAEMIIQRLPLGWLDGVRPPGMMDGCKYIIDRWPKFKYAARYIVEKDSYDQGIKYLLIQVIISELHDTDWEEAFTIIMDHYNNSECMIRKGLLVSEILRRNSPADLKRLSGLLYSEDSNDLSACGNILRKYAEIGTEDCLPDLRKILDFWRKKDKIGTVQAIEKTIQSIEQRLGITPAVNPVHSSE